MLSKGFGKRMWCGVFVWRVKLDWRFELEKLCGVILARCDLVNGVFVYVKLECSVVLCLKKNWSGDRRGVGKMWAFKEELGRGSEGGWEDVGV